MTACRAADVADGGVRQIELAAYMTHCVLEPPHLLLAINVAMGMAFKHKNFIHAAGFARRLLEMPGATAAMLAAPAAQAMEVMQLAEVGGVWGWRDGARAGSAAADPSFFLTSSPFLTPPGRAPHRHPGLVCHLRHVLHVARARRVGPVGALSAERPCRSAVGELERGLEAEADLEGAAVEVHRRPRRPRRPPRRHRPLRAWARERRRWR
jgi:hypothetical protein